MRIALVSETFSPQINGVALTVAALAQQLRFLGHQVLLSHPLRQVDCPLGVKTHRVWGLPLGLYSSLRFGLPSGQSLQREWASFKPDAVYVATEGPLGYSAVSLAARLRIPVVTGFHTRFDQYLAHYGIPGASKLALSYLRHFHGKANASVVATKSLQAELVQHGFSRVLVKPRGIDCLAFSPLHRSDELRKSWGAKEDTCVLLHVGRFANEKNLTLLKPAYEAAKRANRNVVLVMVGDGPQRSKLQALLPDATFMGFQTGSALHQIFASANVFLFPSLTETFGNVTLEAMASGLDVVAFDYAAAKDHLNAQNGYAVPISTSQHIGKAEFENESTFADATVRAALGVLQGRSKGADARSSVLAFAPEAITQGLLNLFDEIRKTMAGEQPMGKRSVETLA